MTFLNIMGYGRRPADYFWVKKKNSEHEQMCHLRKEMSKPPHQNASQDESLLKVATRSSNIPPTELGI